MKRRQAPADDMIAMTSWCPVCRTHIETPLGQATLFDHLLDDHRQWLLSSHGREVISRQPIR